MRALLVLACAALALATQATAQTQADSARALRDSARTQRDSVRPQQRKQARAVRLEGAAPVLDGRLDDAAWAAAPVLSDFVQKQPKEGAEPTERTEVRFMYDADALYVGARMYKKDPASIQAPVSRRDDVNQAEHLWISLDTYLDRRTAYSFGVTAAGTRMDFYHPTDDESDVDLSFDPVWTARSARDSLGWTAEMRIPFSQLRFASASAQTWGLNIDRWDPATKEDVFWIPIPSQERAWASRFGDLTGIEGVRPTRRVELMPYVAAGGTFRAEPGAGNPFDDGSKLDARIGGDVKMGLGPSLTLEATVNPDFGQVEADPAEVNLSAFETFFSERRPFFIEGSQLLEGRGPTYFYSRRIGAAPSGDADGDYVDFPGTSTILGAGKLTGRLRNGTSIGALGAVTGSEHARTFTAEDGRIQRVPVAPVTAFGVMRAQRQFGAAQSTAGVSFTGAARDLDGDDPLSGLLHQQAFAGGADWNLRFRGGEYSMNGYLGFSHVAGDTAALLNTQLSSARYFNRPDADYLTLDPQRTGLAGWTGSLGVARNSGRHWLWDASLSATSPGFEVNDAGAQGTADDVFGFARVRYRETKPGPLLRSYSIAVSTENLWNFGGVRNFTALRSDTRLTFKNYWETLLTGWVDLRSRSDDLTRGGPLMGTGQAWVTIVDVYNNSASRTRLRGRVYYGESELGERTYRLLSSYSIRPSPRWRFSVTPNYLRSTNPRQYVTQRAGGREETFGRRYVFSTIDRSTFTTQLRLTYSFTPDLSLEGYAEPFAASGRYKGFGELPEPGSRELRRYGTGGTRVDTLTDGTLRVTDGAQQFTLAPRDFNVRSFRSNAVLRWEWRPGSTLFAVWQQDRFARERQGSIVGPRDLLETLDAAGDNILSLKISYWLPLR